MKANTAQAVWKGTLEDGAGKMKMNSFGGEIPYTYQSRFGHEKDSNPEELIAAAHSGCFVMALSALLTEKGFEPDSIEAKAQVILERADKEYKIAESNLKVHAAVPGISEPLFMKLAVSAKENCPVSQALSSTRITMHAQLDKAGVN